MPSPAGSFAQLPSRSRSSSIAMLIAASLIWSGQGVAVKLLAGRLQPLAIALLPFYALAPGGIFLLFASPESGRLARAWRARRELLLVGVGGQLLAQAGMTLGINRSLASSGAILSMLIPVLSAMLAVWLLRERLTRLRAVSLLLGIFGVLMLSWAAPEPFRLALAGRAPGAAHALSGNLLIAAGCLGSAFYNVYSKCLLGAFSALEILLFSYLAAALSGLPLLVLFAPHCVSDLARLPGSSWLALGYLAFGLYGLSMILFLRALRNVDAILASASIYLVPLFGVGLGVAVLHEHLGPRTILGSAMTLLSALLLFRFDISI